MAEECEEDLSLQIANTFTEEKKHVLEFTCIEAKKFFLKSESYCNFELPLYFNKFEGLLEKISIFLKDKDLNCYKEASYTPRDYDNVNHVILNNKDGQYAWRPFQLIHPAIYVALVHDITNEANWILIKNRFNDFFKNPKILCLSMPIESLDDDSDKAKKVSYWWSEVEQNSIELALDYEYLMQTDITDCYGSIYTHSIVWALHGKTVAKEKDKRKDASLLGNIIDWKIQDMSHGQTNGIPQGSVLMDFIAEIVLGYADLLLSQKISESKIKDYRILRYRDDYRVFTNNQQEGKQILKYLTEILSTLGLRLNASKTQHSDQVIRNSIKKDKLYWICQKQKSANLQQHLLIIHDLAIQHPNSGSLVKALHEFHKRIRNIKITQNEIKPLISIIVDIAFRNPRTYPVAVAIIADFIQFVDDKVLFINKILNRFNRIPNTEHLEVWLQRITLPLRLDIRYVSQLCKRTAGEEANIWNSEWLNKGCKLRKLIESFDIIDRNAIIRLSPIINSNEIDLFMYS